jgi:hypothetical protein
MKRTSFIAFIAAILTIASPAVLLAEDSTMHDRGLNQWFVFAGLRAKIDSIQSVAQADGNKILADANTQDPAKGYLIITMEYQNPTNSTDVSIPGIDFSFELSDGSTLDAPASGLYGPYVGSGTKVAADTLHPKEHFTVRYVIVDWDGTAITKMFMSRNSGDDSNSTGDQKDRFQIKKGDIGTLAPVPTPTPGS